MFRGSNVGINLEFGFQTMKEWCIMLKICGIWEVTGSVQHQKTIARV
jgi:hypothetical protein